jgi:hypothetical protein
MSEFARERALLQEIWPRGRFERLEDGTCQVVARKKARARDCAFVYSAGPEKKLGILYVGRPWVYQRRLGALILDHLACQREGVLYVKWDPEVGKLLPWFSRRKPRPLCGVALQKAPNFVQEAAGRPPNG